MFGYLLSRLVGAVPVVLLVSTSVFLLLFLTPGDPVAAILGSDASPQRVQEVRTRLGLDDPAPIQLVHWYGRLIQGDLGTSLFLNQPVTEAIAQRAEPTILLTVLSTLLAVAIGAPLGILAATRQGTWADVTAMLVGLAGVSMPTFWVGLNLILLFAVVLNWLPVAGYAPLAGGPSETLRYLFLPAVTLAFPQAALLARMTRSVMLDTLHEDYVRTARAKGVGQRGVVLRHAMRNALIPLTTVLGLVVAVLLGGAVVTEQVFNIPGVGRLLVQAVGRRDYPIVQGVVLVIAGVYVTLNLLVDLAYGALDPRVRYR
ncbi:MAG: ABC transporter permease [Chloroflexota bacterium]